VDDVRRLTRADVEEAAAVLARAFFDYPMLQWVMPDHVQRRRALPVFMGTSVRWGLLLDAVYGVGEPLRGVAIWVPPGTIDEDRDPDDSFVHYRHAMAAIGAEAEARHELFLAEQRVVRSRELGADEWYLAWLGIEPAAQRSGAGSALLSDMFTRLDAVGQGTYLETEKAANVPYYERHAYRVVSDGVISRGGPHYWTMRRISPLP